MFAVLVLSLMPCAAAVAQDPRFTEKLPEPTVFEEQGLQHALFCGDRTAFVYEGGRVVFKDNPLGKIVGEVQLPKRHAFQVVGASRDGGLLFAHTVETEEKYQTDEWQLEAIDVKTGKAAWSISGLEGLSGKIATSPDGMLVAVGDSSLMDGYIGIAEVRVLNVHDGTDVAQFRRTRSESVLALAFSPSGKELAIGFGDDGALMVWNLDTGNAQTLFQVKDEGVYLNADHKSLVYGKRGKLVALHDRHLHAPGGYAGEPESWSYDDYTMTIWGRKKYKLKFAKSLGGSGEVIIHPNSGVFLVKENVGTAYFGRGHVESRLTIVASGKFFPIPLYERRSEIGVPMFSPDGKYLMATNWERAGELKDTLNVGAGSEYKTYETKMNVLVWKVPEWIVNAE